ncbi:MAG: hypothetical protein OEW15_00960 [Nitrospirota bacterium]|nr:hypothetical protein [Nitrospirota bacterium]
MDRPERSSMDDAQKAKLIFISLAAVVTILLIISFFVGNKARNERDAARKEIEVLKQDNAKLSQMLEMQNQDLDKTKRALEECKTKPKAKAKPAAKSKTKAKPKKKGSK